MIAWHLDKKATHIRKDKVLVKGLPTTSGRHGGCRLLVDGEGSLIVGTGDAATGTNPEDVDSLGGKTLRISRRTGEPWPTNRFANVRRRTAATSTPTATATCRAWRMRTDGTVWSMEHGPDRDDEVNYLVNGADYGWNPVPGYNEAVPMTDQDLPGRPGRGPLELGLPDRRHLRRHLRLRQQVGRARRDARRRLPQGGRVMFLKFDRLGSVRQGLHPAAAAPSSAACAP